jgi:hypothetical protein
MAASIYWYVTDFLKALTPLVIGLALAYVAFRQWRTAKAKVRLDLFDRRFSVYMGARNLLNDLIGTNGFKPEVLEAHRSKLAESRFLFSSDVWKFTDELWNKAYKLQRIKNDMVVQGKVISESQVGQGTAPGSIDAAEGKIRTLGAEETELHEWFRQENNRLVDRFKDYLDFGNLK